MAKSAHAQQPPTCAPWINQASWSGTITLAGGGQVVRSDGSKVKVQESATVKFTTDNPPVDVCFDNQPFNWIAGVNGIKSYSVNINDEVDTPCQGLPGQNVVTYTVTNGSFAENAELVINPFAGTYQLTMTPAVNGVKRDITTCDGTKLPSMILNSWIYGPNRPNLATGISLPSTGLTLSGSVTYFAPSSLEYFTDPTMSWTVTWNLTPTPRNFDLVVTIPDYPTWRPAGGKTEKDIGTDPVSGLSILEIDAQLIDKDTGIASTIPPDKMAFKLADVSREPGVSMNWPDKKSASKDPDLAFDDIHNPLASIGSNGATADFTPIDSGPVAAKVSPHDWGGWATLNVTATINGQTIQGHLKGAPNTTNILLPKRQAGSHIADVWKTKHNVPLATPDDDDSEANPVSYPGCVGDGFTTYEEYRGFMENGKHIEGDISAKDFFIQNLIGADAEPGIFQFTELTGLIIHKDIQKNEMDGVNGPNLGDRLINFNHDQGAHVTDQHGVLVGTCQGTDGGDTYIRTNNGTTLHGRPGLTNGICMQGRNSPGTLNPGATHKGSISASDAATQFDLGIAHEFLHSVGVSHHGEIDNGSHLFTLLGPDDPRNTKHVPAFLVDGKIVSLLDEESGTDRAPAMWDKITQILTKDCGSVAALYGPTTFGEVCNTVINHVLPVFANLEFYIGHAQGQHSGDDHCVMRYFFANVYPSKSDPSVYYISKAGTEPKGTGLCISPAGTGINSSSHQPQSRYSDARGGRGACQNWVCVNDKYPPIPD
jgi:hypothetical protein